jgi:hypothetical protein
MASNERKRQQKLARKAVKRKQHVQMLKSSLVKPITELSPATQMRRSVDAPIYECLVPEELFEGGIGSLVFSRELPTGDIAMVVFLLDVFCLGVKNTLAKVVPEDEYRSMLEGISEHETLARIDPACARKLVEAAEAYAADLGFRPHPDYQIGRMIFGDVDANACPMSFKFGKDGKPFYASGPYDTVEKSRRIVETLTRRCGPGGFHYLVALQDPEMEF